MNQMVIKFLIIIFFSTGAFCQQQSVGEIYFTQNGIDSIEINKNNSTIRIIYLDDTTEPKINQDSIFKLASNTHKINKMEFIDFPYSKLSKGFYDIKTIENLYFQNCKIDSIRFKKLSNIKNISFSRCYNIDLGYTFQQLSDNNNELYINVRSCRIKEIPKEIEKVKKIKSFAITSNGLGLLIYKDFFNLNNLTSFSFGGTQLYIYNTRNEILKNYSPKFYIFN